MLGALPQSAVQWDPWLQTLGTTIAATVTVLMLWLLVRKWRAVDEEDSRQREGRCPTCGYNLKASENRCPECGMTFHRDESGVPFHRQRRFTGEVIVDSRAVDDPGTPSRVYATNRPTEAEFARQALVAEGISPFIEGEQLINSGARDGPLYLVVPARDAANARDILQKILDADRAAADHPVMNA